MIKKKKFDIDHYISELRKFGFEYDNDKHTTMSITLDNGIVIRSLSNTKRSKDIKWLKVHIFGTDDQHRKIMSSFKRVPIGIIIKNNHVILGADTETFSSRYTTNMLINVFKAISRM